MRKLTKSWMWASLLGVGAFAAQANAVALNKLFIDGNGLTGAPGGLTGSGWTSTGNQVDSSTGVADATASGGTYWNLNDADGATSMRFMRNTNGVDTMNQTGSRNIQIARIRANTGTTNGTFGQQIASNSTALAMGVRAATDVYTIKDGVGNSGGMPANTSVTGGTDGVWRVYAFSWLGNLNAGSRTISSWYLNDAGVLATGGQWSSNPAHWTAGTTFTGAGDFTAFSGGFGGLYIGTGTDNSSITNIDVDWIGWTRDDFGGIVDGSDGGGGSLGPDGNQQLPWNISGVPVPEPITLSMLALGAIPLAMRRRRAA